MHFSLPERFCCVCQKNASIEWTYSQSPQLEQAIVLFEVNVSALKVRINTGCSVENISLVFDQSIILALFSDCVLAVFVLYTY